MDGKEIVHWRVDPANLNGVRRNSPEPKPNAGAPTLGPPLRNLEAGEQPVFRF